VAWDDPIRDPAEQRGFHLVGRTIRRKRVWLGLSQRQLEGLSGIDQTVISRIETGKQYGVRWVRFARLVDALDGLETPTLESAARSPRYERTAMPPPVIDLVDPARDDDPPGVDLDDPARDDDPPGDDLDDPARDDLDPAPPASAPP
jgi:transcriptional regulator with XRE-family HTH domain